MITTGGTIAGNVAGGDVASAAVVQRNLKRILAPTLKRIQTLWNVNLDIESEEIAAVDSSDIRPEHWTAIATKIAERYDDFDGFIVTHGTNTMGYTCAALAFALPNLNKPVIVTGSQVPYGQPASDALMNLDNAVRTAAYPYGGGIRGVVCVFGSYIITGTQAKKATEFDLDAFRAFTSAGELGRIGRIMDINTPNLTRHHAYLEQSHSPALGRHSLLVEADFDMRIVSFNEFPGMSAKMFRGVLEYLIDGEPAIRGIVFRAFGAGDISHHLHPCFAYLKERQLPVVVTTQAPNGNSNFRVNAPGQALETGGLAIPAFDMCIESITTKLAWLLAKGVGYAQMRTLMHTDLHGEIHVMQERA